MRKLLLIGTVLFSFSARSQNPATVFTIPNRTINLACGVNCTNISVSVPHIKQTTNYVITNPAYMPFAYSTPTGTEINSIYIDDTWSAKISLPFGFCFYNITYPTLLVGSNSNLTFDSTLAGGYNGWSIAATGGGIPNSTYPKATIFGPYHDINPASTNNPAPTNRKIEWRVEGTAPKRRFIASFNEVNYFSSACIPNKGTHQMVLYENTGIIEVYIHDKPVCTAWNGGRAILGVQNEMFNAAVTAAGKNATLWGTNGMDSCFRFIPSGGASRFKSAQLLLNGNVVATGDTTSGATGVLNLNFNNLCPTADSTAYVVRVTYGSCNTPAQDVSFDDTVFVKKLTPSFAFTKTDASCTTGGTITVNASGRVPPFQYSINGTTYQTSNNFTNVAAGNYTIYVKDNANCVVNQQVTIALNNNLTVRTNNDTTICRGASFIPTVITTPVAAAFSWSPTTGVSGSTIPNPFLSPQTTTTYTVTATLGACTATDNLIVTVVPGATANAGPDASIIAGDVYTIYGSASAGTYNWTPSTGLSSATALTTNAAPITSITYTLTVTSSQGCTASDDVHITVIPYCVKPMIAFTPNGDGINDLWLITNGNCLISAKAQVFNRYGAKVFESNDYKNNWNGTWSGKPVPDGTYYYVITYKLVNGKTVFEKGNVTILR